MTAIPRNHTAILVSLKQLETATAALEAAADGRWPAYTAERWRKLRRSLDILAADLRAEFGGWL
jgi:hypothetical protein